ncbi:MAG TPA: autotransporter domain-containing protein, partial [Caulobacteraceae bacterium]
IQAGQVAAGTIAMGGALNVVTVNGTAASPVTVTGAITQRPGGQLQISVNNGRLSDTNPAKGQAATSITIGSTGVLEIGADPINNRNTQFITSGATTIAAGGQIGLTLQSLQLSAVQTYTVIQGAPGSITAPGLGATSLGNAPFLYSASASLVPVDPANGDSEIQLTVSRKTAAQLGFNRAEASAYDAVLAALAVPTASSLGIQQALLAQDSEPGLKSVYDQMLPNQAQGIFQALDSAVEKISAMTATPPDNATHVGGTSLWLQEVNERIERDGVDTLGSKAQALGLVGGYERMGVAGGALGVTMAYFNAQENTTAAQLGARDVASLVEASVYVRRSIGNLTISARGGGGYGWFSENRLFSSGAAFSQAQANWTGEFFDGHFGLAYEVKLFGPYYARPEVSVDYLRLHQSGYQERGDNASFNLAVGPQDDTQFSGQGLMVLGRQWGRTSWFRTEVRLGYREVISGQVGDTTANFADGTPFTLVGDPDKGGWATVGFSLKSGSEFSYFALEGDADFRKGERRYDLRVAGRSVF